MAKHTDRYSNENLINLATDKYEKTKRSTLPTEIIELTSQGKIYPKSSPLSSGKVEMRYMTAFDEDILTNQTYLNEGIVFDKLLESLIVSDVNIDEIADADKDKLIIYARIVSYGKDYDVVVINPNTKKETKTTIDLSKIKSLPFDLDSDDNGEFTYQINDDVIKYSYTKGVSDVQQAFSKYGIPAALANNACSFRILFFTILLIAILIANAAYVILERNTSIFGN